MNQYLALGYIVVGLLFAAYVYHLLSGGEDERMKKDQEPCEDCGHVHLTDKDREVIHLMDRIRVMRGTPKGRYIVGVVTAIACLMITLVWPAALILSGYMFLKALKQNGNDN